MHKRWGWMLTLYKTRTFKVKLLYFNQGKSISMQRHKNRSELWLFIFGEMWLQTQSGTRIKYKKGLWAYINEYEWHKFIAIKPSLVLEIQHGTNCSERDIERA